ncbi:MAG: PAS domain S-box protein [Methanomicrobiales archaeon]
MKIKTQVTISLIVFAVLAVVILFSYFSSTNQLNEIHEKQQVIDSIEKSAFELYYLENDYLILGGIRQEERWNAKYASLTSQIQELTVTDPSQQDVLKGLVRSHREMNESFSTLVAVTSGTEGNGHPGFSPELREFSAGTLTGQTQTFISRASELSQLVTDEADDVHQRRSLIIFSSILVLMVFVLLNYLIINRSVLRSITTLEKGTERIGTGDLDTKIETSGNDELGDLSLAINAMASNLKTVLTSKSELEKEVSERRRVEEMLMDSERRLSEIISFLPDATFAIDRNGTVIAWNRAMEEMTGIPSAQMLGKGDYEYALPFYGIRRPILIDLVFSPREELSEKYSFVDVNGDVLTAETINASPQGKTVNLWGKAAPLYDKDGRATGAIESIRDITERKRFEEALKQSEEKYRLLIDQTDEGVWIIDRDYRTTFVNNRLASMFGYTSGEMLGKQVREFMASGDMAVHNHRIEERLAGKSDRFEQKFFRKDGSSFWVIASVTPLAEEGIVTGAFAMLTDITQRKQAEEALSLLTEFQESVISNARVWLSVLDMRGTILMWNTAAEEISGYSAGEVIGQKEIWKKIYPDNDYRKQITDTINRIIHDKKYLENFETSILSKQGIKKVISWNTRGIPNTTGNDSDYIAIGVDVTDRKLAEEALKQANKKLNLLSSITRHDINNQLTVLRGYITLLHQKPPSPARDEYFQKSSAASERISAMIRFTKEYESIGVTAPAWQDIHTFVDKATKDAPLGNITVKNDIPDGAEVFADPLIVRVCYNLMDNAVRYGGTITTIRFSALERGSDHVIVCEDDGVGIPVEEKEKIFERGYGKNTGMGLFLAREILDITGITIRETGEQGKGARFEMVVPKGAYRVVG